MAAAGFFWDSPALWSFFLQETLPYYENMSGRRLVDALPWTETLEPLPMPVPMIPAPNLEEPAEFEEQESLPIPEGLIV